MTLNLKNESISIFQDGKLKPGIYKIQNIVGQTYVDIQEHTRELCGRPATALEGKGLWDIRPSGLGYTIRRLEPAKPEQFCILLNGLTSGSRISIATFPVAWRIDVVDEKEYCGREYVRFFWGTTNMTWDLADYGSNADHTPGSGFERCKIWELIPVNLDPGSRPEQGPTPASAAGSGSPPSYDGNHHCNCSHQSTEANDDGFGTTVVEVTVTTNTVTTRKKYRVEED